MNAGAGPRLGGRVGMLGGGIRVGRALAAGIAACLALVSCSSADDSSSAVTTTYPAPLYTTVPPLQGGTIDVDDSAATVTVPGLLVSLYADERAPLRVYLGAVPRISAAVRPAGLGDATPAVIGYGRASGASVVRVTGTARLRRISVLIACALPTEVSVSVYYEVGSRASDPPEKVAGCRGGDALSSLDFRLDPARRPFAFLAESSTGGLYTLTALAWQR